MRIANNTIVTINEKQFFVIGRVRYMMTDYYTAYEVDDAGCVLEDNRFVLCYLEEYDKFDMDILEPFGCIEESLVPIVDITLEALIWDIFEARKSFIE